MIIDLTNTLINKWRGITKSQAKGDKKDDKLIVVKKQLLDTDKEQVDINVKHMDIDQANIEKLVSHIQTTDLTAKRKNVFKSIFEWMAKFDTLSSYYSNLLQVYELAKEIEGKLYHKYNKEEAKYLKHAHTIVANLAKNKEFACSLLTNKILPEELVEMTPQDMLSQEEKLRREKVKEEFFNSRRSDWQRIHSVNNVGMYRCGKCKGRNTFYYQAQIRRADEPMTTFVTCNDCSHQWKC